jgi:hypothetical protein
MGQPLHLKTEATNEVQFRHILDYHLFKEELSERGESELLFLEKFYAARLLIERGCNKIYVNATLANQSQADERNGVKVDVCGVHDDGITLAFCETTQPTITLYNKLNRLVARNDMQILLLYPFTVNASNILDYLPPETAYRCSIEQVPWLDDNLENAFQEAMDVINLLCNETRVKMLLPLLKQTKKKREYRIRINPKLVYENIANLMEHNVLHELSSDEYTLTPIGKQILGEYLTFMQRIKKTLREFER